MVGQVPDERGVWDSDTQAEKQRGPWESPRIPPLTSPRARQGRAVLRGKPPPIANSYYCSGFTRHSDEDLAQCYCDWSVEV